MPVRPLDNVLDRNKPILITGGNGFIGSHIASRLFSLGYHVRIADKSASSLFARPICTELLVGNLCDPSFCHRAVHSAQAVLHFAAAMGGMGVIHPANDFLIYEQNHAMTANVLRCSVDAGVKLFFFASSACVYPQTLQGVENADCRLGEADVWSVLPPSPQGLYGLEKLASEILLAQFTSKLDVRIARFHNVYGPRGAWKNGHEKAPAALLRKAFAVQASRPATMELWGDGTQRRSFLFIDDCVGAVLALLSSDFSSPVNIGSDEAVSIRHLADLALASVGVDTHSISFKYDVTKPVGVSARNSDNAFVREQLDWAPRTSLKDGMKKTAVWMKSEIEDMTSGITVTERSALLESLQSSVLVNLQSEDISFAILLPVTSRGSQPPESCLQNLAEFARSLARTTWRDTHALGGDRFVVKVYLVIDADDDFLLGKGPENRAQAVLRQAGIVDVTTLISKRPKGHVCALWRDCARRALEDGCEYFVLMGDDVVLEDEGWMRDVRSEFGRLQREEGVPHGFGCVAFTDTSFPGMPTFPVVHRTHLDIFGGEVVPEIFVNQDGDPYLFQLYRRWGCASMMSARIHNKIGGSDAARYQKEHAVGWTFDCLDDGTRKAETWLRDRRYPGQRKLTIDVVVPCYRVQMPLLDGILQLKPSKTCIVMFIIIVDDPTSPFTVPLLQKYGARPDIRIRVNSQNMGASESRNRGMRESAAEWVSFLDDDIVPNPDVLIEAEKIIRAHGNAAGFVGNVQFPVADTVFKTAVHLAGVTYFWDIATKWTEDVPWGVTANLIARRNVKDGVLYDQRFPKTGGGEDIDFCIQKRRFCVENGGEGFHPAADVVVTHPWWNRGMRSYWRFYMWSKGDGALVKLYPEYSYCDSAPSSAELLLISGILFLILLPFSTSTHLRWMAILPILAAGSIASANVIHDTYRHLWRDRDRTVVIRSSLTGTKWLLAVIESSLVRMFSEAGRVVGMLERREFRQLGRRFDWFVGRGGDGPRIEERKNSLERLLISAVVMSMALSLSK